MKHKIRTCRVLAALAGIATSGFGQGAAAAAIDPSIHPYTAVYQIEYRGRIVGRSEFSVRYDEQIELYRFDSSSSFQGFLRFISPNPVIERSEFISDAGRITSLEFWYEDGSRSGKENMHIVFDWNNGVATATTEGQTNDYSIEHGALDRGTMQVQIMLDMARSEPLGSYTLADEDGLRTYAYRADGDELIETPLGEFTTRAFIQEREGSSRQTLIWAAPELRHLPIRIEQKREGKTRTVLLLESVDWLDTAED